MSDKSDIAIGPVGSFDSRLPHKIIPYYLVALGSGKSFKFFIATKYDSVGPFIKCVGFFTEEGYEEISSSYLKLIQDSPKERFEELQFPVDKVAYIKNLIYRHK